jgi:hypothetical protein
MDRSTSVRSPKKPVWCNSGNVVLIVCKVWFDDLRMQCAVARQLGGGKEDVSWLIAEGISIVNRSTGTGSTGTPLQLSDRVNCRTGSPHDLLNVFIDREWRL